MKRLWRVFCSVTCRESQQSHRRMKGKGQLRQPLKKQYGSVEFEARGATPHFSSVKKNLSVPSSLRFVRLFHKVALSWRGKCLRILPIHWRFQLHVSLPALGPFCCARCTRDNSAELPRGRPQPLAGLVAAGRRPAGGRCLPN